MIIYYKLLCTLYEWAKWHIWYKYNLPKLMQINFGSFSCNAQINAAVLVHLSTLCCYRSPFFHGSLPKSCTYCLVKKVFACNNLIISNIHSLIFEARMSMNYKSNLWASINKQANYNCPVFCVARGMLTAQATHFVYMIMQYNNIRIQAWRGCH